MTLVEVQPSEARDGRRSPFSARNIRPEIMDQPGLEPRRHARALNGLARLNRFSRSVSVLWSAIKPFTKKRRRKTLSILDIACGGGDVTLGLWQRAQRANCPVRIVGFDRNPQAIELSRERAGNNRDISFEQRDVFSSHDWGRYDVVVASLFLHHLDNASAVELLRRMAASARSLVLVNDLQRTAFTYLAVMMAGQLVSRSDIVHNDGPLSVAAAFSMGELESLARRAGMQHAQLTRHWPCRVRLAWKPRRALQEC